MNARQLKQRLMMNLDPVLLAALGGFALVSLALLYSASDGNLMRVLAQLGNIAVAFVAMWIVANMPLHYLMRAAFPIYLLGMILLLLVMTPLGVNSHGATRWLNIGVATIQPSELMKIGVPLMMAWYFEKHEATLTWKNYLIAAALLLVPVGLIARQPDLGTALLISASGFYVLFLAGLSWRIIGGMFVTAIASAPVLWTMLHDYQKHRIEMLFDP